MNAHRSRHRSSPEVLVHSIASSARPAAAPLLGLALAGCTLLLGCPAGGAPAPAAPEGDRPSPDLSGDLEYTVRHVGSAPVDRFEVALFEGFTCEEVDARVPAPLATDELPPRSWGGFEGVEIGVPFALFAVGLDRRDAVVSDGCADVELDRRFASIEVRTTDISRRSDGTYGLSFTVDAFSAEDPDLHGLTDLLADAGLDPAGFLVQYVASHPGTPPRLADELKVSTSRRLATEHLDDALTRIHTPGFLDDVYGFSRAVEEALFDLTLGSSLRFRAEGAEFGERGHHAMTSVTVPVHGVPQSQAFDGDATAMYVSVGAAHIEVHRHELAIPLGRILETVLDELVLPSTVRNAPAHATTLVGDLYDCEAVAAALDAEPTFWRNLTTDVCLAGERLLRADFERHLGELWMNDTLRIQARASLEDIDGDGALDTVEGGEATVRFLDATGGASVDFSASLDGRRVHDAFTHPVHERIHSLE